MIERTKKVKPFFLHPLQIVRKRTAARNNKLDVGSKSPSPTYPLNSLKHSLSLDKPSTETHERRLRMDAKLVKKRSLGSLGLK